MVLDRATEILPEELVFLKRALYPGSRRQTDGSESWRGGPENVRTHSAPRKGLDDGAHTGFQSGGVACRAAVCSECVWLEQDDRNFARWGPKQDGEAVAKAAEYRDFMGHGCSAPSAF